MFFTNTIIMIINTVVLRQFTALSISISCFAFRPWFCGCDD